MIKNEQLQAFLKGYASDAEVIIMSNDEKGQIKHVGMCNTKDGGYKVVLASEKPGFCCDKCGENVYRASNMLGYYCPYCDKPRDLSQITHL